MNYTCSNCGGSVMFDPESGRMKCNQCGSFVDSGFSLKANDDTEPENNMQGQSGSMTAEERANMVKENLANQPKIRYGRPGETYGDSSDSQMQSAGYDKSQAQYMEMNVYTCTSCGAQLMINGNETSTFCSFCGQPTVVFDRVSKELQPNYILPFKITETQAVDLIKERFRKGKYIPDEIKNPKVDKLRGIYIPFWLYTSYIRMQANITTTTGSGKHRRTVHSYRDADCTYDRVTLDASRKLNDELSQRLEPYSMNALQPFNSEYLSGFYADKYDVDAQEVAGLARLRCEGYIEHTLKASCPGSSGISGTIVSKRVQYEVQGIEYALLPAWFMTFWYENELYTVLVNGQTGKVVGNVPIEKKKVVINLSIISIISCIIATMILMGNNSDGDSMKFVLIVAVGMFIVGFSRWSSYNKDRARFKASNTLQYVKGRQDKTWVR